MTRWLQALCILFICMTLLPVYGKDIGFNRDIRPILTEHCFACHGSDEGSREADLRLDKREVALATDAIRPGSATESELVRRIFSDDPDEAMPPTGHTTLTPRQKATLKQWILQGAEYESHWAFTPPIRPTVPRSATNQKWASSPIDEFVLRQLEKQGLTPAPEASRSTLIRRLSLDLVGLPPTTKEVHEFIHDDSVSAYEDVVDRLLESEHFGEHWARMWLDLARYADTKGYEKDNHRDIWRYRDWVIAAYNADMPYAQFTMEQLAGDLLPNPTTEQLLATAFHRNTMTNDEGGTDNEEFRSLAVKDRVDTTMQAWMGLTMGCAKCHSHKYDPISQQEYYQFYAFFNQTEDADRGDEQPKLKTPLPDQAKRLSELREKVEAFTLQQERLQARLTKDHPVTIELTEMLTELKKELKAIEKAVTTTPIMRELAEDKRRETHVHIRGNFLEKGEAVSPSTPEAFSAFPSSVAKDRRGVAEWLMQEQNPLTHRVAVNRVWARLFGVGLVETEEDFGSQGTFPSHPDLLDWLATEFRDNLKGSHKELCKLIVMSAMYRQSSVVTDEARKKDPDNRLFSRAPRFRLSAETVRDQALVAAGLLTRDIGGPSVMPPQPDGIWKTTYNASKWKTAEGKQRYRRGLYTYWRRTSPYPSMMTFDAGSREVCLVRRIRTNIPLQALITMNDPVFVEAAGALAMHVLDSNLSLTDQRIAYAFQRVVVRPPTGAELRRLTRILQEVITDYENDPKAANDLVEAARLNPDGKNKPEIAAWVIVGNIMLNLDETLMRN